MTSDQSADQAVRVLEALRGLYTDPDKLLKAVDDTCFSFGIPVTSMEYYNKAKEAEADNDPDPVLKSMPIRKHFDPIKEAMKWRKLLQEDSGPIAVKRQPVAKLKSSPKQNR